MSGSDFNLPWAGDISITANGDISFVSGTSKVVQRVPRRYLTTPQQVDNLGRVTVVADYLFHIAYGGGARAQVDNILPVSQIATLQQLFLSQTLQEPDVAIDPPPSISITLDNTTNILTMNVNLYLADGTTTSLNNVEIK